MTDKQKKILEKYLDESRIEKLNNLDFSYTTNFINLIFTFKGYHPLLGEVNSIPIFKTKEKPDAKFLKSLTEKVNENRKELGLITDEYASFDHIIFISPERKYYSFSQTWYKGESNSPSHYWVCVNSDGERFHGVFNELIDLNIYSVQQLLSYISNLYQNELDKFVNSKDITK